MSGLCRLIYPQWQGAHFPANSFYKDQFFGSTPRLVTPNAITWGSLLDRRALLLFGIHQTLSRASFSQSFRSKSLLQAMP